MPGPLFTSGILSAQMIFEACTDAQRKALLPPLCNGKSIVVPAITDKAAYWGPEAVETRLSKTPNGYLMNGTKRFVFDADAATSFLCAARSEEGKVVFLLVDAKSPGITVTPHIGFFVSVFEVRFDKVVVSDRQPARLQRRELGDPGKRLGQSAADSVRLPSRRDPGSLRHHLRVHPHPRGLRPTDRPLPTGAGSLRRYFDLPGHGALGDLRSDLAHRSGMDARAGVHEAKATASDGYYHGTNYAHMVWAGPGTDYSHPMMAHSVLAHTLYQYLGTPGHHKRLMIDALYPRA